MTILLVLFTSVAFADGSDIYKGIDIVNYDLIASGKAVKETDGSVSLTEAGSAVVFENVEFYKQMTHLDISYSTQSFVAPRTLELRADSTDGMLIATINLKETTRFTHVITETLEVSADITGKHDLYLIDINGSAGHIFNICAYGMWNEKDITKTEDNEFNRKQMLLNSLDIISDIKEEEQWDRFVSRADFARAVSKALKLYPIQGNQFNFVDAADSNSMGYINALYDKDLINQTGGYIRPDDCIALADTVRAYIELSGYGIMLKNKEPTRDNLLSVGIKTGILKNVDTPTNRYMTYRDMIMMTFDVLMLDAPEVEYQPIYKVEFNGNINILEDLHGVKKASGIITANENTALFDPSYNTPKGRIRINNVIYNAGESGAENYLGYSLRYYYSEDDYGENQLLYIYDMDTLNDVEFVNSEDIKGFANNILSYRNDKNKSMSEKIPTTADVIYNGVSYSSYTDADFDIKEGSVTFLDNNHDGEWDVVSILSAGVYVVDAVDVQNEIIYPKSGNEFYEDANTLKKIGLNNSDVDNYKLYLDGIRVNPGELKEGDILSVYDSKPVGGKVKMRMVKASSVIINDYVLAYSDEEFSLSSNQTLDISYSCLQHPDIQVYYMIHITDSGKIAWFESDPTSRDFRYGYVIKVSIGEDGGEYTLYVKLLDEDSNIVTLNSADKYKVDGIDMTDAETAYNQLLNGETEFRPQVIRYRLNSKGELTMIDTVIVSAKENKEDSLSLTVQHNKVDYRNATDYFWQTAPVDDKTVLFAVPYTYDDAVNAQSYSNTEFAAVKNARQYQGINKYCEGFDGSHIKPLGAIVKYKNAANSISESTTMLYITGTYETLNKEEEVIIGIEGISNGQKVKMTLTESAQETYGAYLKKGDLWLYQKNSSGEAEWMSLVWSKSNPVGYQMDYDLKTSPITYGSLYICYADEILDKYKENISASVCGNEYGFSLYNAKISLYDAETEAVTTITADQIAKDDQTNKEQYAFIYAFSNQVRNVLIINE